VVSAGLFGQTYVASLWPFCLSPIKDIDPTKALPIVGWLDDRRLTVDDWQNIKITDDRADRAGSSPAPTRPISSRSPARLFPGGGPMRPLLAINDG
jgi:hypothetical protein